VNRNWGVSTGQTVCHSGSSGRVHTTSGGTDVNNGNSQSL
jgi:hypothetical protein